MLKHTSVALRPQDAITHTAPTASVSRVYATVFFLPLHATAFSPQCCWLVLSALQSTLTCCEVESNNMQPDGGHSISKSSIHALSQDHNSKHRPAQVQPCSWGISNLRWSFPHWAVGPLGGSHLVPEVCSNNTLSSRSWCRMSSTSSSAGCAWLWQLRLKSPQIRSSGCSSRTNSLVSSNVAARAEPAKTMTT